jgi:hypothetical protein
LRSLPHRFDAKEVAIEECKDMLKMLLDDLMSSLKTNEMNYKPKFKEKGMALKVEIDFDDNEGLYNEIGLMIRRFNKLLKIEKLKFRNK